MALDGFEHVSLYAKRVFIFDDASYLTKELDLLEAVGRADGAKSGQKVIVLTSVAYGPGSESNGLGTCRFLKSLARLIQLDEESCG